MKRHVRPLLWVSFAAVITLSFYACQKEAGNNNSVPVGKNKLSVYLTDAPADYQKVLIDVQRIEVKLDTCRRNEDEDHDQPGDDDNHDSLSSQCQVWDTLSINAGVYDLLSLRNGLDTLLSSGFILNGKIERIKIILGSNNTVLVDSISYPLQLINNQNFVYINIKKEHLDELSANDLQLYLDFNLQKSIKYENGQYFLKPVLKPFGKQKFGEIEGKVKPANAYGQIKVFNDIDTTFALPWHEGEFKVRGLHEGSYSLVINGINGYKDTTITNIMVEKNKETNLGTIELHQ